MEREQSIWVIVPAFNEAPLLADQLEALCGHYQHVVVVDDGSTDETVEVVRRYPVYLLRHLFNLGQGASLRTGMDFALAHGSETLVTFDADGQHQVEDIAAVAAPVQKGQVDVALGSRFLGSAEGIPTSRRLLLKLAVAFTRIFSRLRVTDTHNGLRAFSRTAALRIPITEDRMAHASEILDEIQRQKLNYCEVPVRVRYSPESIDKGQSSWQAVKIASQFLFGRLLR